jgi:hypothetical protein
MKFVFKFILATGLMLGALPAQAAMVDLVVNGGFETGDFTGWDSIPMNGAQSVVTSFPSDGSYAANLANSAGTAETNTVLQQTVGAGGLLIGGHEVTLSFDLRGQTAGGGMFAKLTSLGSSGSTKEDTFGPHFGDFNGPGFWSSYAYTTTLGADASAGLVIELSAPCDAGGFCSNDVYLDNIALNATVVPLPAAFWLFGSALLGFMTTARYRNQPQAIQ